MDYSNYKPEDITVEFIKSFFFTDKHIIRASRTRETYLKKIGLYDVLCRLFDNTEKTIIEYIYERLGYIEKLNDYKKNNYFKYSGIVPVSKEDVTDEFLYDFFINSSFKNREMMLSASFYITNGYRDLYNLLKSCCLEKETLKDFIERRLNISYNRRNAPSFNKETDNLEDYIRRTFYNEDGKLIQGRLNETFVKKRNVYDELMTYYDDCRSLAEFFYMHSHSMTERPKCPVCGKPVNFSSGDKHIHTSHFSKYCSNKCFLNDFDYSARNKKFESVKQIQKDSLSIDDMKIIGVYSDNGNHNFNKMTETNLKKFGLYDVTMKMLNELDNTDISLYQIAYKIIYGDYKRCVICNKPVSFHSNSFSETCSSKCYGKLMRRNYQNDLKTKIKNLYTDENIQDNLKIYNKYKNDNYIENTLAEKRNNAYKNKIKKYKASEMDIVDFWKQFGLDISLNFYKDKETGRLKKTITVKNCCPVHGDCTFDEVTFQNRARRRDKAPMCLECNPLTGKRKTGIETIIEDILNDLNVRYEYENKTFCKPFDTDFYLPDYNIGFEVNGIHWHSGIDNYERHIQKMHLAMKNGGNLFFLWEDDIVNDRDAVVRYIKEILSGKKPEYIHPEDKTCEYFFVNTHNYKRTYNKEDILEDVYNWKICYIIKH